jgi:hypothetical protein
MGWLYSQRWPARSYLIDHLVSQTPTLKHCCVGNNLWCVHEVKGITFVCLYMMQFHGRSYKYWGYKDVDETAGPYQVNCPLSYLEGLSEPTEGYSAEWRESVREYHARRNRKLPIGTRLGTNGAYTIIKNLGNRGYEVTIEGQSYYPYRMTKRQASQLEVFK